MSGSEIFVTPYPNTNASWDSNANIRTNAEVVNEVSIHMSATFTAQNLPGIIICTFGANQQIIMPVESTVANGTRCIIKNASGFQCNIMNPYTNVMCVLCPRMQATFNMLDNTQGSGGSWDFTVDNLSIAGGIEQGLTLPTNQGQDTLYCLAYQAASAFHLDQYSPTNIIVDNNSGIASSSVTVLLPYNGGTGALGGGSIPLGQRYNITYMTNTNVSCNINTFQGTNLTKLNGDISEPALTATFTNMNSGASGLGTIITWVWTAIGNSYAGGGNVNVY